MATEDEIVAGVHAVAEAIAAGEPLRRVIIARERAKDPALAPILHAASDAGIAVELEPAERFRRFGPMRHQHVVAFAPPYRYTEWDAVRAAVRASTEALVIILDHIEDPQNLGAVLRNAEGAGATAAVIPNRRSASMSQAARRAAAGAASHLKLAIVPNLARAMADLKADGCWVYGLAAQPAAIPYTEVDFRGRCAIAVGAEQKGLSRLLLERCDRVVCIPMAGKVTSLNVASAAAVALFEVVRQRTHAKTVTPRNTP